MIRVLIVDDSVLDRRLMSETLSADSQIDVVGTAMNPAIALRKIRLLEPDVITLDVEMTKTLGIEFLRELMREQPLPVVMVSSAHQVRAEVALEALELGAVDYVCKPQIDASSEILRLSDQIVDKVKAAARANLNPPLAETIDAAAAAAMRDENVVETDANASCDEGDQTIANSSRGESGQTIIAIGASTGGTEAIKDVLCGLDEKTPGIVISQHIPGSFSHAFAERLDQNTAISVCEAVDGQAIMPGHAYLAPGDRHLRVARNGRGYVCRLDDGPQVNRHKPSVDVLFRSVAESVGANAVGVLLTGMGDDGANALGLLRAVGAATIAQDETSSVVWGMPGEAVKRGHAEKVLPLTQIAAGIMRLVSKREQKD